MQTLVVCWTFLLFELLLQIPVSFPNVGIFRLSFDQTKSFQNVNDVVNSPPLYLECLDERVQLDLHVLLLNHDAEELLGDFAQALFFPFGRSGTDLMSSWVH